MNAPDWVRQYKEKGTVIKCLSGRYYKYKVNYVYSKEKGRSIPKPAGLLGRITEKDGFIPSEKNMLKEELAKPLQADIKTSGIYAFFSRALSEEIPILESIFGKELADALLVFAMMRWAYQSPLKRIGSYYRQDFCSEVWDPGVSLSDKTMSAVLKTIGASRQKTAEFFQALVPVKAPQGSNFILMDSTCIASKSELLKINAKGFNRLATGEKQMRLMYLFHGALKRPVYYRLVNGGINDVKAMKLCVKEAQVRNAVFIADKGFYSAANIASLEEDGLSYIIPLKRNSGMIDYGPIARSDFKKKAAFFQWQNRFIFSYEYKHEGRRIITFRDERLMVEEQEDYLSRIKTRPELYDKNGFDGKLAEFGTLTLMCGVKRRLSMEAAYTIYKQRNEIEMMFDSYKTYCAGDVMYMQNRHVAEGWLLGNFIAMLAYYKLYDRLRKAKMLSHHSVKDIIEDLKSIHKFKIRGEWNLAEMPERLKKIFTKAKIDILS
jgi:transposase